MRFRLGVLACVAGCWTTTAPSSTEVRNPTSGVLTITATGFGPITAKQTATLQGLRRMFVGYDVKAVNDPNLEYHISSGTEQLAFIVLNDDMTVFNVHATSGKIGVSDRPWRVGAAFQDSSSLTQCECWGDNPTCFKKGEHVAVNFKRGCDGLTTGDRRALKVLDGVTVERLIWSPSELGEGSSKHDSGEDDDADGDDGP